jgi:hypothetical protein
LFDLHINQWHKIKKQATVDGNSALEALAKGILASLWGKLLESPCFEERLTTRSVSEVNAFLSRCKLKQDDSTGSLFVLKGIRKGNERELLTRPFQLGSFCLSYSREIMYDHMKAICPDMKRKPFYYSNNDSLYMSGQDYKAVLAQPEGRIQKRKECGLGNLKCDYKVKNLPVDAPSDTCLIFRARFIGLTRLACKYITPLGTVFEKVVASGFDKSKLTYSSMIDSVGIKQIAKRRRVVNDEAVIVTEERTMHEVSSSA